MKEQDYKIETDVVLIANTPPLSKGKIVGPPINSKVVVEFENGSLLKIDIKNLLSKEDGITLEAKLVEEATRLEREFNEVQTKCTQKMYEAANLLEEAARLARTKNLWLSDMPGNENIEEALSNGGWSTSSWHC